MSGPPRRPIPVGHSKTDLRRGQLTPARPGPRPGTARRPPVATSDAEQSFLLDPPPPAPGTAQPPDER